MPQRLSLFLIASLAVHGALIALWRPAAPPLAPVGPAPALAISLSVPSPESRIATPPPAAAPVPPVTPAAAPSATGMPAAPAPLPPVAAAPEPAAVAHAAAPADSGDAATRTRVYTELADAIARHFHYPAVARQRGWQGLVNLRVHIAPDGSLQQIGILRSSGYRMLDRAALRALTEVAALPAVAGWQVIRGLDMVVPVEYRLVDG